MNRSNEVGGYLELERSTGKAYYEDLIAVNSGRNALLYILKARNVKKLYIPSFLCDSIYKLCEREGILYEFYAVDETLRPTFNKSLGADEWLYIVNFYGQLSNREIKSYQRRYRNIICDNVQAFFRRPVKSVDTVYSCRKFFGVPDGGYVSTNAQLTDSLPQDLSADRMTHILGRFEHNGSDFYRDFQENDEKFYVLELRSMSPLTQNLLHAVDYKRIKRIRNRNFRYLHKALGHKNKLKLQMPIGPYCYPFYCEDGAKIRKKLVQSRIYIPTLWPNVLEEGTALERTLAANILPIPCDQRYSTTDIMHILENLKETGVV